MEQRSKEVSPAVSSLRCQHATGETFNPVVDALCADSDDDRESSIAGPLPNEIIPDKTETKTLNEMEYVFSSTFDEWILNYGVLADHDLTKHGETFMDEDGVLRYVDNWLPVDVHKTAQSPNSIRNELQETGCLRVPVVLHHVEPDDPNFEASQHRVVNVSFLMNFRALWEYLEADNTDELVEYAPLFRLYVELFFHKRTAQILMLVAGYELIVHFAVDSIYPGFAVSLFILNDCQIIFEIVFYLALVRLFKGSVFGEARPELKKEDHVTHAHHRPKRHEKRKFTLHWTLSLQQVFRKSMGELCSLCEGSSHKRVPASKIEKTIPFCELLNLSLKFLSKHSNNVNDKLQLNSKAHNIKLLLILCFLPLYFILIIFVPPTSPYQQFIHDCDQHGSDSVKCLNAQWTFWLSGGYATYIIRRYIYSSAVLLSLIGLNFGAEIAHSLTDSWIFRFGPLRRLANPEAGKETAPSEEDSVAADFSAKSSVCTGANTVLGSMQAPRASHFRTSLEQMMQSSVPLKQLSRVKFGAVTAVEVMPYVQRDSYEHYLFIREFMTIASRSWSGPVVTFAFFAAFLMTTFSFLLVMYIRDVTPAEWVYYALWMSVRLAILVMYPILSLAHANAYVYALQEQFLVAAPEDFAVLGGRDAWMDYLAKVPAIWTVYGMWVTWERLTGVLWTLIAGLGAIAISVVSANF